MDEAGRAMERAAEDLETGNLRAHWTISLRRLMPCAKACEAWVRHWPSNSPKAKGRPQMIKDWRVNRKTVPPETRWAEILAATGNWALCEQMVPQEELRLRSQELMDEIRRRSGALDRSEEERGYLQRLLDRF